MILDEQSSAEGLLILFNGLRLPVELNFGFYMSKYFSRIIAMGLLVVPLSLDPEVGPMERRVLQLELALQGDTCEPKVRAARRAVAQEIDRHPDRVRNALGTAGTIGVARLQVRKTQIAKAAGEIDLIRWTDVVKMSNYAQKHASFFQYMVSQAMELLDLDLWRTGVHFSKWDIAQRKTNLFHVSSSVTRVSPTVFEIRIDAGDATGQEKELKIAIESVWNSDRYHLKVRWVRNDPEAFRITVKRGGLYHYVNYHTRTIMFLSSVTSGIIAHEIGHVLGFGDHYQSYWSQEWCGLETKTIEGDLMADPESPHALSGHWAILDRAYPFSAGKRTKKSLKWFSYLASDVFSRVGMR